MRISDWEFRRVLVRSIFSNCSGVCIRDWAVTVALSICPSGAGRPPTSPAATSLFCALIAATTSLGISDVAASRWGLSQMRIDRQSVVWGKSVSVGVDTGGVRILNNKKIRDEKL